MLQSMGLKESDTTEQVNRMTDVESSWISPKKCLAFDKVVPQSEM